ncbi:hypothetical protein VTJ49DRAFT_824 [Mycothermus thermophilus]|uniref:Uncharacterized protein n=1 Tax=Humicola insolens TaxID=85995 RepID=A0ABR3VE21_HUMIN
MDSRTGSSILSPATQDSDEQMNRRVFLDELQNGLDCVQGSGSFAAFETTGSDSRWRAETIVDTSVRNTWEMDAAKIRFDQRWDDDVLQLCINFVEESLGIQASIRAEPYKMLIYEKGAMFKGSSCCHPASSHMKASRPSLQKSPSGCSILTESNRLRRALRIRSLIDIIIADKDDNGRAEPGLTYNTTLTTTPSSSGGPRRPALPSFCSGAPQVGGEVVRGPLG